MTLVELHTLWAEEVEVYRAMRYLTDVRGDVVRETDLPEIPEVFVCYMHEAEHLAVEKFAGCVSLPPAAPHSVAVARRVAVRAAVWREFDYAADAPVRSVYIASSEPDPLTLCVMVAFAQPRASPGRARADDG